MSLGIREILLRLHLCLINFVVILLQTSFLSEFGAGSDERIHSYTPRTFDFTPEFQLDLIADISMKWRNVRII